MSNPCKLSFVLLASACSLSNAQPQPVSGNIKWTDSAGATHNSRRVRVDIIEENPSAGSGLVATTYADLDGNYSLTVPFRPGADGYAVNVSATNDAGWVTPDGTATPYSLSGGFRFLGGVNHIDTVIGNSATHEQAFGIVDSMYTAWTWASAGRSASATPAPAPVAAMFPRDNLGVSYWNGTRLNIHSGDFSDWDVIDHEYMHYVSKIEPLAPMDASGGGAHIFGVTNIGQADASLPIRTKAQGVRVAWGEGMANWSSIASHSFDSAGQHMPAGVPNVGDTSYTDTVNQVFSADLELTGGAPAGSSVFNNQGEGDENSVMRILHDIGDPANEPHDRIALGQVELFRALRSITIPVTGVPDRHVQQLHDVWDRFTGGTTTYATKADYGAIFEKYGVSPHPFDDFVTVPLVNTAPAPTIHWLRQNNFENDTFEVLIFSADLSTMLFDIPVVGDVTSLLLPAADWAAMTAVPGLYRYVVVGGDRLDYGTGVPVVRAEADQTLGYWSDAYGLVIIPAPGAAVVMLGGALIISRRRRVS